MAAAQSIETTGAGTVHTQHTVTLNKVLLHTTNKTVSQ